jgi:hypothetical protein
MRFFKRMVNLLSNEKTKNSQVKNMPKKLNGKPVENDNSNRVKHVPTEPIKKTIPVNVGIDFGTSFTKVCFSESQNTHNFVKFNGSEFKPSIIYYDFANKSFYYNKPNIKNIETIEYFKYSMIGDSLPRSRYLLNEKLSYKPEILCSLFFLACLIKEIEEYITGYFIEKMIKVNIDWSFIMGVPIENYENKNKFLYDKILNIAYKLSNQLTKYSAPLNFLADYYDQYRNKNFPLFGQSNINTLPELYAESLAFLKDRNVDRGVYALMDIGGGTVDMAILYKKSPSVFNVTSKDIQPLGIEIVSKNISKDNSDVALVKKNLRDNDNLSDLPYISRETESKLKEDLRISFAKLVMDSKKKEIRDDKTNKHIFRLHNGKLPVVICGGGANHKWYEDGVNRNLSNLRPVLAEGLKLDIWPVEKLFSGIQHINHRLLIAYALSGRIGDEITELQGYPWHFPLNTPVESKRHMDIYDDLQETQKEIYGEN